MSNRFYKVMFEEDDRLGVAYAVKERESAFLPDKGNVEGWEPLSMNLRDGDFPDYLASDLGFRLCSERLKRILEEKASPSDVLQWLEVLVRREHEERRYFILHFPEPPDLVDKKKSILAGHFVVKAVLSRERVGGHRVFGYQGGGSLTLFISDEVKKAIEQEHCTGMDIADAPLA